MLGILAGVVVALAGVVVALAYLLVTHPAPELAAAPPPAVPTAATTPISPPTESVAATAPGDAGFAAQGYILPVRRILISPKVCGMIVNLHILEGNRVKKGEVLAELEDVDYRADFLRAQAAVETARQQLTEAETGEPKEIGESEAEIDRAKVELAQWKSDFERDGGLYAKHALSKADFEAASTKYRAAEQHLRSMDCALSLMRISLHEKIATAHTKLDEAEADLTKARWRLESCMVRAPSDGTILKKNAEEGDMVNAGASSLCELANLSQLEVELAIQERDIGRIRPGQPCKVRTEAFPERVYDGVVSQLMPVANRVRLALPVRVKIAVPQEEAGVYLKPEMRAMVSLLEETTIARLDETEKPSRHGPLRKPNPPPPASHRRANG